MTLEQHTAFGMNGNHYVMEFNSITNSHYILWSILFRAHIHEQDSQCQRELSGSHMCSNVCARALRHIEWHIFVLLSMDRRLCSMEFTSIIMLRSRVESSLYLFMIIFDFVFMHSHTDTQIHILHVRQCNMPTPPPPPRRAASRAHTTTERSLFNIDSRILNFQTGVGCDAHLLEFVFVYLDGVLRN